MSFQQTAAFTGRPFWFGRAATSAGRLWSCPPKRAAAASQAAAVFFRARPDEQADDLRIFTEADAAALSW